MLRVRDKGPRDLEWIESTVRDRAGDAKIVRQGRTTDVLLLPTLIAEDYGIVLGLAAYELQGGSCELVAIDAVPRLRGTGSALLSSLIARVPAMRCRRLYTVTTNDNLDAIWFFQRRGFSLSAIHRGAATRARQKPAPGNYGIPIRDEIELEIVLLG